MLKLCRFSLAGALLLIGFSAHAAVTPLSIAIAPPVQFPHSDFTVAGLRLSALWGKHRAVYGFDIGAIGNITDQSFTGVGIAGIFNKTSGSATAIGLQLAGITNINTQKAHVVGLQLAGAVNSNGGESTVVGFQIAALANLSAYTTIYGFQVGLYNRARQVNGLQIGLVNVTESLKGLQIGLLNFNRTGLFSVAPIINVGF